MLHIKTIKIQIASLEQSIEKYDNHECIIKVIKASCIAILVEEKRTCNRKTKRKNKKTRIVKIIVKNNA